MDKKWLWVPWIGLCILFIMFLVIPVVSGFAELFSTNSNASLGDALGILVYIPVIVICLVVLVVHLVFYKYRKTHPGDNGTKKDNHSASKTAMIAAGVLALVLFTICIVYILKG